MRPPWLEPPRGRVLACAACMDARPRLSPALDALLADLCKRVDAFRHIRPTAVLVVAGAAQEHSRATIRGFPRGPTVTVARVRRRYEVTLRPLFFQSANGLGRLVTLCHELFHVGPACDGMLDEHRRHARAGSGFDDVVERLARDYAARAPHRLLEPLAHEGEVLFRHWRVRPGGETDAGRYTERDLFEGPLCMHTPRGARSGWW
ncbi:MAG: hypothetical protein HY904_23390 [Deltaproteobacteria bacterium]|nr:hypothetical protein [Deltaproteobacteria bacterium]